jgi:hypothetical protein
VFWGRDFLLPNFMKEARCEALEHRALERVPAGKRSDVSSLLEKIRHDQDLKSLYDYLIKRDREDPIVLDETKHKALESSSILLRRDHIYPPPQFG